MTLDEAIKHLQFLIDHQYSYFDTSEFEAMKLGIEALKREKARREGFDYPSNALLPSETQE